MDVECVSIFFHRNETTERGPKKVSASQNIDSLNETMVCLPQQTDEHEPLEIPPLFNITPRYMPKSPHQVIEENFATNPWAMLVATIFLTKTSGKTAMPYMRAFFKKYPTPYHVLRVNPKNLERFFDMLGLRKRAHWIWKMTHQFVSGKWRRASDLCGIGKYGEDAYRIFILGHTDLCPSDRYLKLYLNWLSSQTEFVRDNAMVDSEFVIEDPVLKYYRITLRDP